MKYLSKTEVSMMIISLLLIGSIIFSCTQETNCYWEKSTYVRELDTNGNWYYKLTSVEETDEYNGVGGIQPTDDANVVIGFDVNCD
jgi:hypothetical protein